MHKLMTAVREAIAFEAGVTNTHTTAADALKDGKGVCQDHAHVFISAARSRGIPARYVSGYLFAGTSDEPRTQTTHGRKLGYRISAGSASIPPTALSHRRYVRLAAGLDAAFAAPIRGTRGEAATKSLT